MKSRQNVFINYKLMPRDGTPIILRLPESEHVRIVALFTGIVIVLVRDLIFDIIRGRISRNMHEFTLSFRKKHDLNKYEETSFPCLKFLCF